MEPTLRESENQNPEGTEFSKLTDEDLMNSFSSCPCCTTEEDEPCKECWRRYTELKRRSISSLETRLMESRKTKWRIREHFLDHEEISATTLGWIVRNRKRWLRKTKKDFKAWIFGQARNEITKEIKSRKAGGISLSNTDERHSSVWVRKAVSSRTKRLGDSEIAVGYIGDWVNSPYKEEAVIVSEERHVSQEPWWEKVQRQARIDAVLEIVGGLASEKLKDAISLVFNQKKKWTEAARLLGMPASTLASQWETLQADIKASFCGELSERKYRKLARQRTKVDLDNQSLLDWFFRHVEFSETDAAVKNLRSVLTKADPDAYGLDPSEERLQRLFVIDRSEKIHKKPPKFLALFGPDGSENRPPAPLAARIEKIFPESS